MPRERDNETNQLLALNGGAKMKKAGAEGFLTFISHLIMH
jgi:hypothetical protein